MVRAGGDKVGVVGIGVVEAGEAMTAEGVPTTGRGRIGIHRVSLGADGIIVAHDEPATERPAYTLCGSQGHR